MEYALGRTLYFQSLRVIGANRTQVILQSNVVVSIVSAVLIFQEPLTPRMVAGICVVMVGLWLVTWGRQ